MAMQKAIVATPVDGTKEAITSGVNGLLVPCQQPEELAQALLKLHRDPALRTRMAEQAFKTVQGTFALTQMVQNNENIYRSFMNPAHKMSA